MAKNQKNLIMAVTAIVVLGAAIGGLVSRGASKQANTNTSLQVVASYYPLYEFARNIGGSKVQVTNMTPAGSEPHDYEPTPQQLVTAQKAKLFIYNGATLEPWVAKFLPDFTQTALAASSGIDLFNGLDEQTGQPSADVKDPHFWLDPSLAQQMVTTIRDGLMKVDPANRDYYTAQAKAYSDKLKALDTDFKNSLASCRSRSVVSSHDAFGYLAKRYNLDIVSIAGLSPDEEPSAARLAELTQVVKDKQITHVFFESLVSPKLAETLANETGTKTAVLDPIEGISNDDQKQGKDYIAVQRQNLQNLRTALACQ